MLEGKFIKAWCLVYLHVHICLYVMCMLKFIASYNPLSLSLPLSLSFSLALSLFVSQYFVLSDPLKVAYGIQ